MKPVAKKGLMLIGILYTAAVAAMITNFAMGAKPKQPEAVVERIQARLSEVQAWAHEADPEHIRGTEITEEEARHVFEALFPLKGTIINVNFTLIVQCLNFAILLMVLYGFAWDPLLQFLDRRRALIKQRLEESDLSRQAAAGLVQQRQDELNQLREERGEILDKAKRLGEREHQEVVERARREAERIMKQTEDRLHEQQRQARAELREEVAKIGVRIATQVLKREISRKDHDRVIEEVVQALGPEGESEAGVGGEGA